MKRFFSALFMYFQIGVGCGLMLTAIAFAASPSAGDPDDDVWTMVVAFSMFGAPLLMAGLAKFLKRFAAARPSDPSHSRSRDNLSEDAHR